MLYIGFGASMVGAFMENGKWEGTKSQKGKQGREIVLEGDVWMMCMRIWMQWEGGDRDLLTVKSGNLLLQKVRS